MATNRKQQIVDFKTEIEKRLKNRKKRSLLDINTRLEHFAIISYKVPIEKIEHLIPKPFKLTSKRIHNNTTTSNSKLSSINNIAHIESYFVMSEIKNTTSLPVL